MIIYKRTAKSLIGLGLPKTTVYRKLRTGGDFFGVTVETKTNGSMILISERSYQKILQRIRLLRAGEYLS